jgi:hypothetical protein
MNLFTVDYTHVEIITIKSLCSIYDNKNREEKWQVSMMQPILIPFLDEKNNTYKD